jgi:hypothetical protein
MPGMTPTKGLSHRLYNYIDTKAFVSVTLEKGSRGFSGIRCAILRVLPTLGRTFLPLRRKNFFFFFLLNHMLPSIASSHGLKIAFLIFSTK